jgi:hypothetical protein
LRIKEQETRLNLHGRDDDDYVYYTCKSCFFNKEVNPKFVTPYLTRVSQRLEVDVTTTVAPVSRQICVVDDF